MAAQRSIHGLLAEFDSADELVRAARQAQVDGWRRMDCYTPYLVEEAAEAIGTVRNRLPPIALIGGICGGLSVFALQAWSSLTAYPLNIGGRPLFSWPAFVVPAFEGSILGAGVAIAVGMLALNRLPSLYHPLFNAPNFRAGATKDKFFLCLEAEDAKFDVQGTRAYLEGFHPSSIVEVEL
jgi:hypothetical protein